MINTNNLRSKICFWRLGDQSISHLHLVTFCQQRHVLSMSQTHTHTHTHTQTLHLTENISGMTAIL